MDRHAHSLGALRSYLSLLQGALREAWQADQQGLAPMFRVREGAKHSTWSKEESRAVACGRYTISD